MVGVHLLLQERYGVRHGERPLPEGGVWSVSSYSFLYVFWPYFAGVETSFSAHCVSTGEHNSSPGGPVSGTVWQFLLKHTRQTWQCVETGVLEQVTLLASCAPLY